MQSERIRTIMHQLQSLACDDPAHQVAKEDMSSSAVTMGIQERSAITPSAVIGCKPNPRDDLPMILIRPFTYVPTSCRELISLPTRLNIKSAEADATGPNLYHMSYKVVSLPTMIKGAQRASPDNTAPKTTQDTNGNGTTRNVLRRHVVQT